MKGGVTRFMPKEPEIRMSRGHCLAAGSIDGRIVIWDTVNNDEIELCPLVGYLNRITSLSFSFDGSHIVSSYFDQKIRVWSVKQLSEYENDTNTYLIGLSSLTRDFSSSTWARKFCSRVEESFSWPVSEDGWA